MEEKEQIESQNQEQDQSSTQRNLKQSQQNLNKTQKSNSNNNQDENQNRQQQPQDLEFDLEVTKLQSYLDPPIYIDPQEELFYFLQNGVLKSIEHPKLRERYIKLIGLPIFLKLIPLTFWFVFATKFPGCVECPEPEQLVLEMRQKLSKKYVKIFASLIQPKDDHIKDELVNLMINTLGWLTHYLFYKFFAKQRFFFDFRFIIDCYHILIFEFNGVYVSDFYINANLERLFTNRFLCYESLGKPKKKTVNRRPSRFLGNFKLQETPMNSKEVVELKQILTEKFKVKNKVKQPTHQYDDLYTEILRDNLLEKTAKSGGIYITQQQEHKTPVGKGLQSGRNSKNQSHTNLKTKDEFQLSSQSLLNRHGSQQHLKPDRNLQEEVKQPYFGGLQLNCCQVSPTIGKVLHYNSLQLPYMKKKMIKHVFDTIPDQQNALLAKLKLFNRNKFQQKEAKVDKKYNQSLIDTFGLRQPNKEYYQKHENLDKMFKDMLDLNYVLKNYRDGMTNLPSSISVLKYYEQIKKQEDLDKFLNQGKQEEEKNQEEEQLTEKKKTMKLTDRLKMGMKRSRQASPAPSGSNLEDQVTQDKQQNSSIKLPEINSNGNIQTPLNTQAENLFPNSHNTSQIQFKLNTISKSNTVERGILKLKKDPKFNSQDKFIDMHRTIPTVIQENPKNRGISNDDTYQMKIIYSSNKKDDFVYVNKSQKYKEKYSSLGKYQNTDTNIDNLQNDLKQKQNLIKKGITHHVHNG